MKNDTHSQSVPEAVITAATAKLDEVLTALKEYATPLIAAERRELLKMGDKSLSFVEQAHKLATANPGLRSKYFDMGGFDADFTDAHELSPLAAKARQVLETVEDIQMTAGSEAYHAANEFYADVKSAAERDVPEARAVYETLKAANPHKGGRRRKPQGENESR